MEPMIPYWTPCIFRSPVDGSRQSKTVLFEHHSANDPKHGGRYTVKRYKSEKVKREDGGWGHTRIALKPFNWEFEAMVFESESEAEGLKVSRSSWRWCRTDHTEEDIASGHGQEAEDQGYR